jgi:invasion protein IalB
MSSPAANDSRRLCPGWNAAPRAAVALAGVAAALIVTAIGLASPVLAQGAVRSVHGDWQVRCDTPPSNAR